MFSRIARHLAGRAARQVVSAAQQRQLAGSRPAPQSPDAAILFAMKLEAAPTWARMESPAPCRAGKLPAESGRLGRQFCVAAVGGVGERARGAARQLLTLEPQLVISAGLGGALNSHWKTGDVLVATSVAREQGPVCDFPLSANVLEQLEQFRGGRLLSVDEVVRRPVRRAELAERHEADVCDMETAHVAEICQHAGVPMLAVRVISDESDQELPADIATLLQQPSTAARLGAAAGAVIKQPGRAGELWRLRQAAADAAEKLAAALTELLSLAY